MERAKELVSRVLGVDGAHWGADMRLAELPKWDSFHLMILIAEMEATFHVNLTMEEAAKMERLGDVERVLIRYGIAEGK